MSVAVAQHGSKPHPARFVAIITDGNGRWARARRVPVNAGHDAGAENLKARLHDAVRLGIEELTVYSFSTENWSRPIDEVEGLISMLAQRIARETPALHREGVRMRFIGHRRGVAGDLLHRMSWAERLTAQNRRITLFVAFNYGGRAEIVDAAKRFQGNTEEEFRACLYAPDMHDPDLIIRTGGEQRLSNYLLWQSAHAELVFRDELWPDFTREALEQSLAEFSARRGRPGGRAPERDEPHCKIARNRATSAAGSNNSELQTSTDRHYSDD
jgi:undecaprenyl diphosphate synthase